MIHIYADMPILGYLPFGVLAWSFSAGPGRYSVSIPT